MSKDEQGEVLADVRKRRCEANQSLACNQIKAERFSEKLRSVADALPKGREEDHDMIMKTPTVDALLTLHGYICADKAIIAKCNEQLDRFARTVQDG